MRLRRRTPAPSPDRWLISYADFITLLFAFFVVLYGVAQNDRDKPRDVAASVKRAFGGIAAPPKPRIKPAVTKAVEPGTPQDLAGTAVFLASAASDYVHGHVLVVDGAWMAR